VLLLLLILFHLFRDELLNAIGNIWCLFYGVLATTLLQSIIWDIGVKIFMLIVLGVILYLRLSDIQFHANFGPSNGGGSVCYALFAFRLC